METQERRDIVTFGPGRTGFPRALRVVVGVLALVVATLLVWQRLAPEPATPRPSPPPQRLIAPRDAPVWADRSGIHVGDQVLRPARTPYALTLVADGVVYRDQAGGLWHQPLASGVARRIGRSATWASPVGQADGDAVAWVEGVGPGPEHLVLYDVARGRRLLRSGPLVDLLRRPSGDWVSNEGPILYADRDRVVYAASDGTFELDRATLVTTRLPGEEPGDYEVPDTIAETVDAVHGLRAVVTCCTRAKSRSPLAFADERGRIRDRLGAAVPSGLFNHDWTRFADVVESDDRHHVEIADVGSGQTRTLTTTSDVGSRIAWGYGDVLVVARGASADPARPELLACMVRSFACTPLEADPGPDGFLLPAS